MKFREKKEKKKDFEPFDLPYIQLVLIVRMVTRQQCNWLRKGKQAFRGEQNRLLHRQCLYFRFFFCLFCFFCHLAGVQPITCCVYVDNNIM